MALTRDDVFWTAFTSHAEKCVQAAKLAVELFEHPDRAEKLCEQVGEVEYEGDQITQNVITALHQTWITPLDREEIHSLIVYLDDVLDNIESAVDRFTLFELKEVQPQAVEMARALERLIEVMNRAVLGLKQTKDLKPLLALTKEISRREREIDTLYRKSLADLHKPPAESPWREAAPDFDVLAVLKWRDVLNALEEASDCAQDVGHVIEGIVLEHS
jgi:predicted phosphate transport protein (TIGR00153 family)